MKDVVRLGAVVLGLTFLLAGCSDSTASPTSTEAVVIGEGELPDTVPTGFPIPPGAEIGSTLVDHVANRTEFRLTMPGGVEAAVRTFELGLVNQGYVITSSEGTAAEWTMSFTDGELTGSILTTAQASNVATALVTLYTP